MAEQTTNLGLTKPDAAEGYDIAVFNGNADVIDGAFGALLETLGGTGGGLGDKVDTLLTKVDAVKTDTAALVQALATANANIATLLNSSGSVKKIITAQGTIGGGTLTVAIPNDMRADRIMLNVTQPITWSITGNQVVFTGPTGYAFSYQLIEFY